MGCSPTNPRISASISAHWRRAANGARSFQPGFASAGGIKPVLSIRDRTHRSGYSGQARRPFRRALERPVVAQIVMPGTSALAVIGVCVDHQITRESCRHDHPAGISGVRRPGSFRGGRQRQQRPKFRKSAIAPIRPAAIARRNHRNLARGRERTVSTARPGDYVVRGVNGEHLHHHLRHARKALRPADDRARREGFRQYTATGSCHAFEYDGQACPFVAPWGRDDCQSGRLHRDAGHGSSDIYRIERNAFLATYREAQADRAASSLRSRSTTSLRAAGQWPAVPRSAACRTLPYRLCRAARVRARRDQVEAAVLDPFEFASIRPVSGGLRSSSAELIASSAAWMRSRPGDGL